MAGRRVDATWDWCAPTETLVVALPPARSVGGAAFETPPWQDEQVSPEMFTTPFTCVAATTVVEV
jgi:hypothetical protein